MNFTKTKEHDFGGCFLGYPTIKITEQQMQEMFGRHTINIDEYDLGYTGYWQFEAEDGERISIGFRWGVARFSGWNEALIESFDKFLSQQYAAWYR